MVHSRTGRLVRLALLVSLALIIWMVELAIPTPFMIPGAKLGLANVIVLWCLVTFGLRDAILVSVLRAVLGSLLTGTLLNVSFFLSLAGGLSSAFIMGALLATSRRWVSLIGVSLAGAFTHNLAQVLTASVLIGHRGILIYLPYLLLFALPTGFFVGILVHQLTQLSVWKESMANGPAIEPVRGEEAKLP